MFLFKIMLRAFICGAVGLLALNVAHAQESIRPSQAGAQAAEARKQVLLPSNYNIKLGPALIDLSGHLEVEFNDNVGLSEVNRESDIIIHPSIQLSTFWQVTRLNTLQLNVGVGYAKYLDHSDLDSRAVVLDPGSGLSYDIYVGDFRINIHDRFTILQNPTEEIQLSNVANFDRFQNSAGINVLWDLNDLKLVFGYDHFNFWALNEQFDYLDRSEEQFFASASLDLSDANRVGLDISTAFVDYDENFNNDGTSYSAGAFWEMTLSNYVKLRIAGGWQGSSYDGGATNGDTSDYNGYYCNATISHRLNAFWMHSLAFGHESRLGLASNFSEFDYVRYMASWRANSFMTVSFEGFAENSADSGNSITSSAEEASRYGLGASCDWRLNRRTTMNLRYQFVGKDSDVEFRSYYQNRVILNIGYDF